MNNPQASDPVLPSGLIQRHCVALKNDMAIVTYSAHSSEAQLLFEQYFMQRGNEGKPFGSEPLQPFHTVIT